MLQPSVPGVIFSPHLEWRDEGSIVTAPLSLAVVSDAPGLSCCRFVVPPLLDPWHAQPMLTEESIEHIRGIVAEHGSDAWWEMETADLLPPVRLLANMGSYGGKRVLSLALWSHERESRRHQYSGVV